MSPHLTDIEKLERLVGAPITRVIDIDGENHEVLLKRIKIGRIPKIALAAGPLMSLLSKDGLKLDIPSLLTFHSTDALNLLAALLNKDREFVDELDFDDAATLLADVIELNIDFFVRRVLPVCSGALQRLYEQVKERQAAQAPEATGQP